MKLPFRANNSITQSFNSGVVTIYDVEDGAAPGYAPVPTLTEKGVLRYEEQRLGIQRYYAGRQNQLNIQRVIRVPSGFPVTSQDVAITEDGEQYRVDMVQTVPGVFPASLDLTLVEVRQRMLADRAPEVNGNDVV